MADTIVLARILWHYYENMIFHRLPLVSHLKRALTISDSLPHHPIQYVLALGSRSGLYIFMAHNALCPHSSTSEFVNLTFLGNIYYTSR